MNNLFKIHFLVLAFIGTFVMDAQAQMDVKPFMGDVTIDNKRVTADWTFESVSKSNFVMKNSKGYLSEVHYNRPKYTRNKSQAVKFMIDKTPHPGGNWGYAIKPASDQSKFYSHKGGYFLLHDSYLIDGSTWIINKRQSSAPSGVVTLIAKNGISESFRVGDHNSYLRRGKRIMGSGFPNAAALSVKVTKGYKVTLFNDPDFKGLPKTFTSDADLKGSGVENRVSSLKVEKL